MDVKLVIQSGPTRKRALHVHAPLVVIGRQRGCGVRIPSAEVSRRHCLLRLHEGFVTVEDLASSNGTRLNGVPVSRPEVVRPGDRLEVGPITFVVEYALSRKALNRLLDEMSRAGQLRGTDLVGEIDSVEQVLEVIDDLPAVESLDGVELPAVEEWDEQPTKPTPTVPGRRPPSGTGRGKPAPPADEDAAVGPLETGSWSLPESDDLRDLLSGLADPGPTPAAPPARPAKPAPPRRPRDGRRGETPAGE